MRATPLSDDAPDAVRAAAAIMNTFLRETGVTSDAESRRYLWTDAFAVCNCLGLYEATGEEGWLGAARRLVDRVHHDLGRHRADDPRSGWISGLSEEEGERRPTAGGLRIGKPLPERRAGEPWLSREEWDRDGQYFHYLTRWVHALTRLHQVTGETRHARWAADLTLAACDGFVRDGRPPMVWKMSIDLTRPLVPSMGRHDPLDGLVTLAVLRAVAPELEHAEALEAATDRLRQICRGARWTTDDPLGAGGLLVDAWRLGWLAHRDRSGGRDGPEAELTGRVVSDAAESLLLVERAGGVRGRPESRLAFRELGLAIGLSAGGRLGRLCAPGIRTAPSDLETIADAARLGERIQGFWSDPAHRDTRTWREHADINAVMLATSLSPGGYLSL